MSTMQRKEMVATARALADRQVEVIASNEATDAEKDTIAADGWQLDRFLRNPVALWAHDYRQPPVARYTSIGVVGGALRGVAEFSVGDAQIIVGYRVAIPRL